MNQLLAVMLISVLLLSVSGVSQPPPTNEIVRLGGVSAENGEFGFLENLITAYPSANGDIRVDLGKDVDPKDMIDGPGGPLSLEVKNTGVRIVQDVVPLAAAYSFQFCDDFDQVSVPTNLATRTLLPKGAKVKSTEDLIDGRTLIAYTTPNVGLEKISLALLSRKTSGGFILAGKGEASSDAHYCGILALTSDIRAVLVDEPAGSSDHSAVYLFAIKKIESNKKK